MAAVFLFDEPTAVLMPTSRSFFGSASAPAAGLIPFCSACRNSDAVGEVLLLRVARHVGERQNGDRRRLDVGLRIGDLGPLGGGSHVAGVPLPDLYRTVDVLDTYVAAIVETNVDPIPEALVDDRGGADPTRLGERLQARGNVDAIALDVVVLNNDIAKIDTDSEHDGWLRPIF